MGKQDDDQENNDWFNEQIINSAPASLFLARFVKFPNFIFYRGSKQKTCKNMQWTDGPSNTHILDRNDKVVPIMPEYEYEYECFCSEKDHLPIKHPSWSSGGLTKAGQKETKIRKSFNGRLYLKIIPVKSSQCFLVQAKCKGIN